MYCQERQLQKSHCYSSIQSRAPFQEVHDCPWTWSSSCQASRALSTHQDRLLRTYAHMHLNVHPPFRGSNPFCPLFWFGNPGLRCFPAFDTWSFCHHRATSISLLWEGRQDTTSPHIASHVRRLLSESKLEASKPMQYFSGSPWHDASLRYTGSYLPIVPQSEWTIWVQAVGFSTWELSICNSETMKEFISFFFPWTCSHTFTAI